MDLSDIQTAVKNQFGDTSGAVITDTDITRWANAGQVDIVKQTGELTTTDDSISTTAGTEGYALPADVMFLTRVTYDGRKVERTTLQALDEQFPDRDISNDRGMPTLYYLWDDKINFFPVPDTSGVTVKLWYSRVPATLAATSDVPEIPVYLHEDLVRYCLVRAKEKDDDFEAAKTLDADFQGRLIDLRQAEEDRQEESYPSVRPIAGDEGYDGYYY